jgi:CRP-like cAMP-binding protein
MDGHEWTLLASLDTAERESLLSSTTRRRFARGDVLVHQGDPSDSLHLVERGRVAVRVATTDGDTATLNILGPGDFFGELSLIDGSPPSRTASVVALEPVETRRLAATAFSRLRERHPAAEQLLLSLMARRVQELSSRLLEAMYEGLDRRVCRRLDDLAGRYGDDGDGGDAVVIPLTQEDLAGLVGGTRQSVNEVLQRLAALGVVELRRGRIVVQERDRLADEAT